MLFCGSCFGVQGILILQQKLVGEHAIIVAKKVMLQSTVQPRSARNLALYAAVWGIVLNNAARHEIALSARKVVTVLKDCPEKFRGGSKTSKMCLKCGNSGREMFSCKNDYSKDDLKEMQCYVRKRFGHLCCVNTTDATLREIFFYKCGQLGHTGLLCSRLRTETTVAAMRSSCNKYGEEGHFGRECSCLFLKACSRFQIETTDATTPSSCYEGDEEGHFARECSSSVKEHFFDTSDVNYSIGKGRPELSSTKTPRFQKENDCMGYVSAPHEMCKARKKKKPLAEERSITTPQKSKHIGGWMIEHPEEFSHLKSKGNSWRSPVTPSNKSTKIYSFSNVSHTPSSKYSKMMNIIDGTPNSRGSAKAFHHRFASRFCYSGSDEFGRSYNWR